MSSTLRPGSVGFERPLITTLTMLQVLAPSLIDDRAIAQCFVEEQKLTPPIRNVGAWFGWSVSTSHDVAVVTAMEDDCVLGPSCGAAFVFEFDGSDWSRGQLLTPDDLRHYDEFGWSGSVSGNTVLVGSVFDDCMRGIENCGSAYTFYRFGSDWIEEQKLNYPGESPGAWFGAAVVVQGDRAVVGAPGEKVGGAFGTGAVYVFELRVGGWTLVQRLTAEIPSPSARFGEVLAIDGDNLLIGAPSYACERGPYCGAVYAFHHDGDRWKEQQILVPFEPGARRYFGNAIAVSRDLAVIGTHTGAGRAYVFRWNGSTWIQERLLRGSETFGSVVEVDQSVVFVGAPFEPCQAGRYCGPIFLYKHGTGGWNQVAELTASDIQPQQAFGSSMSIGEGTLLVGAVGESCGAGRVCGSAYVFRDIGPAKIVESFPLSGSTLPRTRRNITRVTLDGAPASPVGPGDVEVVEMLDGGGFGEDESASFTIEESDGVITLQDNGATLKNKTWYRVRTTGNNGCIEFDVCLLVLMGDANEDMLVNWGGDQTGIFNLIPTIGPVSDYELRRDINGDGFINFADLVVHHALVPTLPVPVPAGHACP